MKNLSLKEVMQSLVVMTTADGFELQSPAGKASYDKWGARQRVEGIPEYFPKMLAVESPNGGKLENTCGIEVNAGESCKQYVVGTGISVNASATKTRLSDDMRNAVIDAVRESGLFAELTPQKQVVFLAEQFKVTNGQVFTADAIIGNALSLAGAVKQPQSDNVITVNINTQHNDEELSAAIAKAIKASLRPGGLIHGSVQKR